MLNKSATSQNSINDIVYRSTQSRDLRLPETKCIS